jgi:tRNA(Met) C34 N-acetyltransferase TmcA
VASAHFAPAGDPVERWLNQLLCLDASIVPRIPTGCPPPDKCELYYVNKVRSGRHILYHRYTYISKFMEGEYI